MKTKVRDSKGCLRAVKIEVSADEISQKFDQVYADIGKAAKVPGFRAGHAPRDLLETYYGQKAQDEVIKRAIPEYYLKAVSQEGLTPVAPPEIEDVQFQDHTLCFVARVDVRPEVRIKGYKHLKISRKRTDVGQDQVEQMLQRLRESRAKAEKKGEQQTKILPELNDAFAKELGLESLQNLKDAIRKELETNTEHAARQDMERQLIEQVIKKTTMDVPQSLVNSQIRELVNQLKVNRVLHGEKKEDLEAKEQQLQAEAVKEAVRRVKLSFILEEIAQQENIQADEQDLETRIEQIAQRSGKAKDEVRQYLKRENLIPGLKQELTNLKTIEFLIGQANVEQGK